MHDEVKNNEGNPTEGNTLLQDIASSDLFEADRYYIPISGENLKRWGFQYAIKERDTSQLNTEVLLQRYQYKMTEEQKRWDKIYEGVCERYNGRISAARKEIEEIEKGNLLNDSTHADLQKRKEELKAEIKAYFEKVIEVRKKIAEGKKNLAGKCLDEAKVEIDKAMALNKSVYDETKKVNEAAFENSKKKLEDEIAQLGKKRDAFMERYTEVNKRMKLINADGINPSTAYVLIGVGTSAAAAAGYFFSVFTSNVQFSSQDAVFFVLNGFMKAGGGGASTFLMKAGYLLLFILLTGMISFACFRLFNKFIKKEDKKADDHSRISAYKQLVNDTSGVSTKIKAGSWFSFWLQITPLVFIAGIVILVLALRIGSEAGGDGIANLNKLNASLEGMLAGTTAALAVGGLLCLYVMKIIEPRLLGKQEAGKPGGNWFWNNWELALCVLCFLVFTGAIAFYPLIDKQFGQEQINMISISEFIAVTLLSAFSFAYGVRFRGLIAVSRFLQREVDRLDADIAMLKAPLPPESTIHYSKTSDIVHNMLIAIDNKVKLLQTAYSPEQKKVLHKKEQEKVTFFKRLGLLFKWRKKEPVSAVGHLVRLAEWEQYYFPDLNEELILYGAECAEKEREYREVVQQLEKLESDNTEGEEEKIEKRKKLQKDIETMLTYLEKTAVSRAKLNAKLDHNSVAAETAILDGFHLGIWYRENQLGPRDDYYLNYSLFQPKALIPEHVQGGRS